ncbi:hypothetical protein Tco_0689275 [Tanacetum coccineum]
MNEDPIPDDVHLSDLEDTDAAHLPKIKTRPDWLKPILEEETPESPEPDWAIPPNDLPETKNNWANAIAKSYKDPKENKLLRKTGDMGSFIKWYYKQMGKSKLVKADLEGPAFKLVRPFHKNNISLQFQMEECHLLLTDKIDLVNPEGDRCMNDVNKPLPIRGPPGQWFKRKEFCITKHSAQSDRNAVRSHMRILSVVSLKTYSRYGYTYLREIVLRRANYKEYKISESDLKNLHPNDFEDLYLLHLQGKLNHLSGAEKVHLFTTVNMWIRNIVIRQRVEDLQLGIESYQTKINLTELRWDATDFLFREDYTIIHKLRAVIYRDRNNQKNMMRETELHKFNDGTLTRVLEKLDFMVKDYELFKFNPGMEHRIWTEDDKRRIQEFIKLIERRLKMRRIFRNLESFVAVSSSLRSLKPKCTIESRAKRSSINLIRTLIHYTCLSHTVKTGNILRVLCIILVVLPEHPSDTQVFTVKMEILLEPTSNKLYSRSDSYAGNHVKEILLNLNLPDHRSFSSKEEVFLGVLVKGGKAFNGVDWKCGALTNKCGGVEELMQVHLMDFNSSIFGKMCGVQYYKCGGVGASEESAAHNVISAADFLSFG